MSRIFFNAIVVFFIGISFLSCKSAFNNGFVSIFDGKTLNNWKGDSKYWHVENGKLVGIVTPETILKQNTFIIWQGDQPEDFELKLSYKISESGNSGINYRSQIIKNRPFALKGYQADIDGKNKYTGQNYEEKKRTTLAYRGEKVIITSQEKPDKSGNLRTNVKKNCWQTRNVVASLGNHKSLSEKINKEDWNDVHLIVKGNVLKHYVNGILMSEVVDKDSLNQSLKGFIGVQVHVGPPMKVEFKDIKLKKI